MQNEHGVRPGVMLNGPTMDVGSVSTLGSEAYDMDVMFDSFLNGYSFLQ